jgi:hypothetical protein
MIRGSYRDVLCLVVNPKRSSRISPWSLTSCKIVANRFFWNRLPNLSNRLMSRQDEGIAGSLTGLRIEITRAWFHAVGKWWVKRTALKIGVRKDSAHWGRYFKALFGTPFGPGALLTLKPLMASSSWNQPWKRGFLYCAPAVLPDLLWGCLQSCGLSPQRQQIKHLCELYIW